MCSGGADGVSIEVSTWLSERLRRLVASVACLEAALRRPGHWIAGIDCSFGQARQFVEDIGWTRSWEGHVQTAAALGRDGYRRALDAYRTG
jgi:hypothetical protein